MRRVQFDQSGAANDNGSALFNDELVFLIGRNDDLNSQIGIGSGQNNIVRKHLDQNAGQRDGRGNRRNGVCNQSRACRQSMND